MMAKIVFEVGANSGGDTQRFIDEGSLVYAFEPTPELHLKLKDRFKTYSNYMPVPLAVDLENRWSTFNIAGSGDWGCSSLYEFDPNIHNLWGGRPDFVMTDKCTVMTIRLDTFMDVYRIPKIDYLWIDAQGNDFKVLLSLGDKIDLVQEGQCEVALEVNLYSAANNDHRVVRDWLREKGFDVSVESHGHHKEADIKFKRRK